MFLLSGSTRATSTKRLRSPCEASDAFREVTCVPGRAESVGKPVLRRSVASFSPARHRRADPSQADNVMARLPVPAWFWAQASLLSTLEGGTAEAGLVAGREVP